MEMRGIEPRASRMQSERSTIWATSPLLIRAIRLTIGINYHDTKLKGMWMEMRGIEPRASCHALCTVLYQLSYIPNFLFTIAL